jgi:cellobiose phosphorylase
MLKTPFGLKLMSPANLGRISKNTAAGEYFQGDRENGGIFKHACMMATSAMFKAAKEVLAPPLAARLCRLAYWMVDLVLPYNSMKDPYSICGNPRFCTQYNNSETGENIGPMLSGTATWLTLTLLSAFGIEFNQDGIKIDPVLREEQTEVDLSVRMYGSVYNIRIIKPEGFCRLFDKKAQIQFDGIKIEANILPAFYDSKEHSAVIDFYLAL